MRDYSDKIERLADLIVGFGANLQPGQILSVTANLGMEDAARAVARAAYTRGAKYVDVFWWDQLVKRERLLHAAEHEDVRVDREADGSNGSRRSTRPGSRWPERSRRRSTASIPRGAGATSSRTSPRSRGS